MSKIEYPIAEHKHAINGVPGRMLPIHAPQMVRGRLVYRSQEWCSEGRSVSGYGTAGRMFVKIRFDDQCKNGHQTFAITANVYTKESRSQRDIAAGGCMHDEIANVFPELVPLIQWHSVSTDSPTHYVANAVYHASDKDCFGRRAGEPCAWEYGVRFGDSPVTNRLKKGFWKWLQARIAQNVMPAGEPRHGEFRTVAIPHVNRPGDTYDFDPHYTLIGYDDLKWHECPFGDEIAAQEFALALNTCRAEFVEIPTAYSKGKARDFDAARRAAKWPEATDEQLSADPETLRAALLARLPELMAEFRASMENAGFLWEPNQPESAE